MTVGSALKQGLGRLALWLMPLTVIYEWVGGTFAKSMFERLLYLALFLALFWLTDLTPSRPLMRGAARRALGVLLLGLGLCALGTAFVWLLGPRLGLAPWSPPVWLSHESRRLLLPLLAAWPLAVGSSLLREPAIGARSYEQLGSFVGLGFLLHFASDVHVQALPVIVDGRGTTWLLSIAALVLLALATLRRGSFALRLCALVGIGLALRGFGIAAWAIDPAVRDMLALVQSAQDRFADGQSPYALYAMQRGSELPLTYFPGLWLGYGLPRLVGLDLRFMGTVAEAALFLVLALVARRQEGERRAWAEALVACFAAVWFFSPSVQWNAIYAEPTLWWALLGVLLALAFSGRFAVAALLLGYAVATRHFAVVLAPFVLLYFVRSRGLRGALPYLALSFVTGALLLTPFVLVEPELFWFGTLRWLREYGPAHLSWFFDRFGFMQPFAEHDALALLPWVQGGLVGACFVGALLSKRIERIPSFAATAALLFIMFNVLLWDSFLLDGAIAAAAVVLTRRLSPARVMERGGELPKEPSLRVVRWAQAGLALSLCAGVYLSFTLVKSLRPRGHQEAHDFMVSAVHAGDFVIDRSDRRLAFVQGSWLLRQQEVPAPIGGELYDGAWGGQSALSAPGRAWLVTQTGRDRALRRSFSRLGREVEVHDFEDYRVQAVEPRRPQRAQATALPEGAGMRSCQVGWANQEMLGVMVSAARPAQVTFSRLVDDGSGADHRLLLSAGFPNGETFWPRRAVRALIAGATVEPALVVENLGGMQWQSWEARALPVRGPLRLELRSDDELPRLVCLELLWLPPTAAPVVRQQP